MASFITNVQVKFLEKKHPLNKTGLKVILLQKILECSIIGEDDPLGVYQV